MAAIFQALTPALSVKSVQADSKSGRKRRKRRRKGGGRSRNGNSVSRG